jgi:hypothetical protein
VLALLPRDFPNKSSVPSVPTKSVIVGGPQEAVTASAPPQTDDGTEAGPSGSHDTKGAPSSYVRGKRGRFTKKPAGSGDGDGDGEGNEDLDVDGGDGEENGMTDSDAAEKRQRTDVSVLDESPVVPEVDASTVASIRATFQFDDITAGIGAVISEAAKPHPGLCGGDCTVPVGCVPPYYCLYGADSLDASLEAEHAEQRKTVTELQQKEQQHLHAFYQQQMNMQTTQSQQEVIQVCGGCC